MEIKQCFIKQTTYKEFIIGQNRHSYGQLLQEQALYCIFKHLLIDKSSTFFPPYPVKDTSIAQVQTYSTW